MIGELGTHHDGDSTLIEFQGYIEYHDYRNNGYQSGATFPRETRVMPPPKNMTRLEDLQPTTAVRGILPDQVVTVVSVQWFVLRRLSRPTRGHLAVLLTSCFIAMTNPVFKSWSTDARGASTATG